MRAELLSDSGSEKTEGRWERIDWVMVGPDGLGDGGSEKTEGRWERMDWVAVGADRLGDGGTGWTG